MDTIFKHAWQTSSRSWLMPSRLKFVQMCPSSRNSSVGGCNVPGISEETAIRRCHLWFSHWHPSTVSDRTIENVARLAQASDIKVENFVLATLTIAFFTVSWQQRLKPLGLTVALHFVFKATDTKNDWKKRRHEICETN